MLFGRQTHETHSYYHLVTAESPFICTRITVCTKQKLGMEYSMLPHTHHLPSLSRCCSLCQKVGVVLCWAWSEKSMDSIGGISYYLNNVSCYRYQTRCWWQCYLPFNNTAHAWTGTWCAQHSSTAAVQNSKLLSISPELWPQRARAESIDYDIWGVYSTMNMSCKSTKLKKSNSNWLHCRWAVITNLSEKMWFSCFRVLPSSAEALHRCSENVSH